MVLDQNRKTMTNFLTKHNCYNGGQKHNFEAIWEIVKPDDWSNNFKGSLYQFETIMKCLEEKRYRGHVCLWCGKVVNQ